MSWATESMCYTSSLSNALCLPLPPAFHERCHLAHMMLVSLAAIGDPRAQAMYDRLRGFYNSCRPSGSRLVPPLEEWHGVGAFCDDVYCRYVCSKA